MKTDMQTKARYTAMQKRRALFTLSAFIVAPLVFLTGNFENMFSGEGVSFWLSWWLAASAGICAWLLGPRSVSGTKTDVRTGVVAGICTALLTPALFGLGLGAYSFFATIEVGSIFGRLAMALYLPVIFFLGAIYVFGLISVPLAALVGGLIYAPVFEGKDTPPET